MDGIRGDHFIDFDPRFKDEDSFILEENDIVVNGVDFEGNETQYVLRYRCGHIDSPLRYLDEENDSVPILQAAIECDDGYMEYRDMGKLHRENGPAVVNYQTGYQEYWQNGQRHRVDGPAVIYSNGAEEYWIRGVQVFSEKNDEKK